MKKNQSTEYREFELFHEYGCLVSKRIIYFGSQRWDEDEMEEGGVEFSSSKKIIKNLTYLDNENNKNIQLYFNSPGGEWHHGMAIYDCIKGLRSKVIFIGFGYVRSMGSIIIQACHKRYLTPNCRVMIHDGYDGVYDIPKIVEAWAEESKVNRNRMYEIYYEKMIKKDKNITIKKIENLCTHDYIISGEKAVEIGLADKIL